MLLTPITNDDEYEAVNAALDALIDKMRDENDERSIALFRYLASPLHAYEERQVPLPEGSPAETLRLLMQQHGLKQDDLAGVFGSQSAVSAILNGKREINAHHARALA